MPHRNIRIESNNPMPPSNKAVNPSRRLISTSETIKGVVGDHLNITGDQIATDWKEFKAPVTSQYGKKTAKKTEHVMEPILSPSSMK